MNYIPSKTFINNTYKSLHVRGYTVGELFTLAKIGENEIIAEMDTTALVDQLTKVLKPEEGYSIRDLYLVDVKFALLYAMMLTDEEYKYGYRIKCKECEKDFVYGLIPRKFMVDTRDLITEAEVHGFTVAPITFGDWIDSLEYTKTLEGGKYSASDRVITIVACLLKLKKEDGTPLTFLEKLQKLQDDVPASVALSIVDNDYAQAMDIKLLDVECECTHCKAKQEFTPSFLVKDLLPSV